MKAEISGRPLLATSLALIAGVSSVNHPINLCFFGLLLWLSWGKLPALVGLSLAFLIGLVIAPDLARPVSSPQKAWSGQGLVVGAPSLGGRVETCVVETDSGSFQLVAKQHEDLSLGQTLSISGVLLPLGGQTEDRLSAEGIAATILCKRDGVRVLRQGPPWFEAATAWRNAFMKGIDRVLPGSEGNLVNALCFAAASPVQSGLRRDLSRTGSVHILSASGLQVFLLAFLVQTILSLMPIPRGYQVVVIVFALALYASATGLHAATIRAVIMASLAMVAYLFRREPDFLSALGLAAILTVLWQPWTIYSPGFQLSYATVAALSLYWRRFFEPSDSKLVNRILSRIWFVLRTSLVATLAAAPLSAYHFGVIPLVAPVTNLLIAPAVPVVIAVSMLAWPLGFLLPSLQVGLLKVVVSPLASWIAVVTGVFGRQPWAAISCPGFNGYWLVLYYGAFMLLWNRRQK